MVARIPALLLAAVVMQPAQPASAQTTPDPIKPGQVLNIPAQDP